MTATTAIVWFRRDLRLADNPALASAVEGAERVVAVYVHAPDDDGEWRPGAASDWWLHRSLAALDADLRGKGIGLTVRRGPVGAALGQLAAECGASAVHWNRLYEPALVARDALVARQLRESGLHCETHDAGLLHDPQQLRTSQDAPYRVFTPFWRACQRDLEALAAPLPAPRRLVGPTRSPASLALDDLELSPRVAWDAGLRAQWTPGETGAHARLAQFCEDDLGHYDTGRDRPDLPGTSRLSPHLHFGELSPRQAVAAVRNAVTTGSSSVRRSAEVFLRELGWREFAHHLLHHFPQTATRPLDARFERYPWRRHDGWLEAWQQGRTGYPLVDAAMRELWATGWMHNRARMVVASLLTKNLGQHWLDGAHWFWDTLVDADLANNTLGWQWTAGCGADAAPFFRIFNPVAQAERHDPRRVYLRRWLPELAALPDAWIHRPWLAPADVLVAAGVTLDQTYPRPVVDLASSRRDALAAYAGIRTPATRDEA